MKKQLIAFIILSLLFLSSAIIGAFLTYVDDEEKNVEVGAVELDIVAYFEKRDSNNQLIDSKYVDIDYKIDSSLTKFGIVGVNISNLNDIQYFDNLVVDILVKSSVDTFFRIAPYEQFTLTYESNGKLNEVSITKDEYQPFNYNLTDFYDNRIKDGFFYYKHRVKRINETTPQNISFIMPSINSFPQHEERYSLQIGFLIEAVQYYQGPQINWGFETVPWDNNITWEETL